MNRRSFFRSIAKAAAIVALAPQLAFKAKPLKIEVESLESYWTQDECWSVCVSEDYLAYMAELERKAFSLPPSLIDSI